MEDRSPRHKVDQRTPDGSIYGMLSAVLRYRRFATVIAGALVLIVALLTLARPRTYTASASFIAREDVGAAVSQLAGIAAQFGVSVGGAQSSESPEFYAELLTSRTLLDEVVQSEFVVAVGPRFLLWGGDSIGSGTLVEILGLDAPDLSLAVRRAQAQEALERWKMIGSNARIVV